MTRASRALENPTDALSKTNGSINSKNIWSGSVCFRPILKRYLNCSFRWERRESGAIRFSGRSRALSHSGLGKEDNPSGSDSREVLQGTPILEKDTWDALASPFYCSGVVHIPGEIEDPLTIHKLSELNKFLVNMRYDFHEGIIEPGYTQSLQRELDQTPTGSLTEKLDSMFSRERAKFYTSGRNGLR